MEAVRQDIVANPKAFLKLIKKTEKDTGMPITAETYKRPKPCSDKSLERFFAWKGCIACEVTEPVSPELFGPDLGIRAGEFLQKLIPLYDYFNKFKV